MRIIYAQSPAVVYRGRTGKQGGSETQGLREASVADTATARISWYSSILYGFKEQHDTLNEAALQKLLFRSALQKKELELKLERQE